MASTNSDDRFTKPPAANCSGDSMMPKAWTEAAALMKSALNMLDESDAPPEIGARLDFTISSLEQAIRAREAAESKTSRVSANSNHS
jgi:hypothetical protein